MHNQSFAEKTITRYPNYQCYTIHTMECNIDDDEVWCQKNKIITKALMTYQITRALSFVFL